MSAICHGLSNHCIVHNPQGLWLLVVILLFSSVSFAKDDCTKERTKGDAVKCLQEKIVVLENNGIKKGTIVMWSGGIHQIPDGWALCDGQNGTPNLQERFILAASDDYPIGTKAGTNSHDHGRTRDHVLTKNQIPHHQHTIGHGHVDNGDTAQGAPRFIAMLPGHGADSHRPKTHLGDGEGGQQGHSHQVMSSGEHLPLFYALAFIMKK